jgi:hypothetical protein
VDYVHNHSSEGHGDILYAVAPRLSGYEADAPG